MGSTMAFFIQADTWLDHIHPPLSPPIPFPASPFPVLSLSPFYSLVTHRHVYMCTHTHMSKPRFDRRQYSISLCLVFVCLFVLWVCVLI